MKNALEPDLDDASVGKHKMIRIRLNGENKALPHQVTLKELTEHLNIRHPHIAIAVNSDVIPRSQHPEHRIKDGDKIEILQPIGGG